MRLKQEDVMDYTYFDDTNDFVKCILDDTLEESQNVVVFCKSDLAMELIKHMETFVFNRIDIDARDEGDYVLFISTDLIVDCIKADSHFTYFEDEAIYVHGDCSSEIAKDVVGGNWCEFEFEYEIDDDKISENNDFLELNFTCDCCGLYVCISPIEEDEECELWTTEMYLEDESGTRTEIVERQSFEEVKAIRDEWIENFR